MCAPEAVGNHAEGIVSLGVVGALGGQYTISAD